MTQRFATICSTEKGKEMRRRPPERTDPSPQVGSVVDQLKKLQIE